MVSACVSTPPTTPPTTLATPSGLAVMMDLPSVSMRLVDAGRAADRTLMRPGQALIRSCPPGRRAGPQEPADQSEVNPAGRQSVAEQQPLGTEPSSMSVAGVRLDVMADSTIWRHVGWRGADDARRMDSAETELGPDWLLARGESVTPTYALTWSLTTVSGWVTETLRVTVDGGTWSRSLTLR